MDQTFWENLGNCVYNIVPLYEDDDDTLMTKAGYKHGLIQLVRFGSREDILEAIDNGCTTTYSVTMFLSRIAPFIKGDKLKALAERGVLKQGFNAAFKEAAKTGVYVEIAVYAASMAKVTFDYSQGKINYQQLKAFTIEQTAASIGSTTGGIGGSWVGASAGAVVGSIIFPGIGTTVGATIGTFVGGYYGGLAGTQCGHSIGKRFAKPTYYINA